MRTSSLALLRNWWEACEEDSNITNPNVTNVGASRVYIYLLRSILLNDKPEHRYNDLIKNLHYVPEDVREIVTDRRDRDVSGPTKGYVLHSLHFAVTAVDWNGSFSSFMDYIIKDRPYTDTDTNAAIAGAVLGARMGFKAMIASGVPDASALARMEEPITRENYRIMMRAGAEVSGVPDTMNSEWIHQRPREYSAPYLEELVQPAVKILTESL